MFDTKASAQTYKASCHCGAFAYTVTSPSLYNSDIEVVRCNCSICTRNGHLFVYIPNDEVVLTSGKLEDFKSYTFATRSVAHYFCPTCGSSCLARSIKPGFFDGTSIVNVRMFEDVELDKLKYKDMDGRSYNQESAEARVAEIEADNQKK